MRRVPDDVGRSQIGTRGNALRSAGDEVHGRVRGQGAGPLGVEVALGLVGGGGGRRTHARWRILHHYRAVGTESGDAKLIAKTLNVGALHAGLTHHADRLAGANDRGRPGACIDTFLPDLADTVDGREILGTRDIKGVRSRGQVRALRVRSRPFPCCPVETANAEVPELRLRMEVVEGAEAGDDRGQGSRNVGIAGVGVMALPVDSIAMDLRVERLRHLACGAAEVYKEPSRGDVVHRKSMLRKPLGNLPEVAGRRPELFAELLRRKPPVEAGRPGIILPVDELRQLLFLRRTAPQHHEDVW